MFILDYYQSYDSVRDILGRVKSFAILWYVLVYSASNK